MKYKKTFFFLFCCVFLWPSIFCINELAVKLETEIQQISSEMPSHAGNLISGLTNSGELQFDSFRVEHLEDVLNNKYHLDASIVNKFKNIAFSSSLVFQTFRLEISKQASLSEFIGAARNINNMIEIAFLSVQAQGNLLQQYDRINERSCSTSWLIIHECHDNWRNVPRGFTTAEIEDVSTALRASAYRYLVDKITQSDQINGYGLLNSAFRFVKGSDHFYTINANEHAENSGYRGEGVAFYTLIQQRSGTIPLFRFFNGQLHFYSTDGNEGLRAGYHLEGDIGFIYTESKFGTLPIYRYVDTGHFYCLYPEMESLNGWRFEGIIGYAYPTNSLPSINNQ